MKKWTSFDDFWNAYKKAWLPYENENIEIPFVVNNEKSVWYYVPIKKFLDGTMIENGKCLVGQDAYGAKIDNDTVHDICRLLEKVFRAVWSA